MTQSAAGAAGGRVGTGELRVSLERSLGRHFGAPRRITGLERRPSAYSSSFAIEELDVRLDDGTGLRLLFKNLSRQALLETARRVRPAFLYDPLREIQTYRIVLEPNRLGMAACYGALVDRPAGRYGLFLEKVPGLELYQVGDLGTWQQVARWLAATHARFAGKTGHFARAARLLRHDADSYRLWIRRARASWDGEPSSRQPGAMRRGTERLIGNYERVVERLAALPATFIHGEFYASNVLVQRTEEKLRVCPVDWEMAAVGPGLFDLAALTAGGGWTADEKTAMALAYRAALAQAGGPPPAREEEFLTALDYCRLHLAVQMSGWSSGWSPPPEHAQDWLGEALGLARRLGLA